MQGSGASKLRLQGPTLDWLNTRNIWGAFLKDPNFWVPPLKTEYRRSEPRNLKHFLKFHITAVRFENHFQSALLFFKKKSGVAKLLKLQIGDKQPGTYYLAYLLQVLFSLKTSVF